MANERPLKLEENQLGIYIGMFGSPITMEDAFEQAQAKFGEHISMADLKIDIENHQARGCMCCYDPSDYDLYLIITYEPEKEIIDVAVA